MKYFAIGLVLLVLVPWAPSGPEGIAHWTRTQLQESDKKLSAKLNERKMASESLGAFGNHSLMIARREGDGEAELHEKQSDVFFVQSGEATLVVGGAVVDGKTVSLGEIRGPSIKGGEKKKLGAGDMVHIPPQTPHQLLVDSKKPFTYVIVKVDAK